METAYILDRGTFKKLAMETVRKYINKICEEMRIQHLDVDKITRNVYPKLKLYNTIDEIEDQIIMSASEMVTDHYDYPHIAVWILMRRLHTDTDDDYRKVVEKLRANVNRKGKKAPMVSKKFAEYVQKHHQEINAAFRYERDFGVSIFGYRTLERSYLKRGINGKLIERPQHMYMRVAIALHYRTSRLDRIIETYHLISQGYYTHATPTLFNAGTKTEQLSSCFLLGIEDDMGAIGECWKDCALISKYAGGIGINMTNIRVYGSYIHSTQGRASGMRILAVFNQIARYADQGGKRAGSIAIYIEPWHGDIFFFLDLKKNTGAETDRTRDLFLALMVNDIFMKRVKEDAVWSLMCPSECPDLINKYGAEFTRVYENYEKEGKYLRQVNARDVWFRIMESQIESGVPYVVFKDAVNYKSNQINIGVVNGSNLCVSGDTMILTSKGYHEIKSLVNQEVEVWNGQEFSQTTIKKTGENQKMMQIKFSNETILKCTPYHIFYLENNVVKNTLGLEIGDQLVESQFPILDLSQNEGVPINGSMKHKRSWLEIFLTLHADSCDAKGNYRIKMDTDMLHRTKLMLQTMGYNPLIEEKHLVLRNLDAKLLCLPYYEELNSNQRNMFKQIMNFDHPGVKVTGIKDLEQTEDTYCFTEQKRHVGIFNGIIAGQCSEIVEVSTADEYAVCNLASICLPKYIIKKDDQLEFDYHKLYEISRIATRNLNNIIDINYYPVEKTRISNIKHRPIGIGIQGLADVFAIFKTPFDSVIARDLNKKIFETIYFGAMMESMQMAKEFGPYQTFSGSPLSQGKFQFDLWGLETNQLCGLWDWEALRQDIVKHGVRNSLTTACMPTASTSQIQGNNETIEPYTENIYSRSTMAGDFYVINKHLMKDLMELNLWNEDMVDLIKYYKGSVQNIPGIPNHIKEIYRTSWEIPQKSLIEMSADRGPFIDQTQSLNIFIAEPNFKRLTSCLFYGWEKGLKTGMYYLRSKAGSEANQFGIDISKIKEIEAKKNEEKPRVCVYRPIHLRKEEECMACSS